MASEKESIKALPCIHLVVGEVGEYSDHQYWFASSHHDKAEAEQVSRILNSIAGDPLACSDDNLAALKELDRSALYGYPGAEYDVVSVPLGVGQKIQEKILASNPSRNP